MRFIGNRLVENPAKKWGGGVHNGTLQNGTCYNTVCVTKRYMLHNDSMCYKTERH
jgi:hypothetical protein